ncbi:putative TIM9-translocase of the mitochondrial inner membrane [Microstroma glucosiphilum]|uniref:Mitochondrial import inner membrane translocase subunit n=1 Tax=Pseudomicrostroma glucosiphilum TaxID=1684307 RepID=A0A316UAK0_9BASI|nr:putative TIM9-translocase of the mitochondrial inner membrane [Pseudomicrostroma glucosiphilum]PWN21491.1 putative TIM9-translocase of the mitochondrial inner membrane [Pseudomicrostroma glucosiphilum]
MDFSQLSPAEASAMEQIVARKQMRDFTKLYSGLVERCFGSCVDDFTSRALTTREEECVDKCTMKFLKHSERVGARFQEENAKMMAQQQAK